MKNNSEQKLKPEHDDCHGRLITIIVNGERHETRKRKMDTKEQAKKKAFDYASSVKVKDDESIRIDVFNEEEYRVTVEKIDGAFLFCSRTFPFAEPTFGDLAWCWDREGDTKNLLISDGENYWCEGIDNRKLDTVNRTSWKHYKLLGINIADKLDSSGTEG